MTADSGEPAADAGRSSAFSIVAVVIGRNEGERLRRCLQSLLSEVACLVYVDSGSTDGSVELAAGLGVHVVRLDLERPFTAARARNAGLSAVCRLLPGADFVQFVDGDCEIQPNWVASASAFLARHPSVAVVCGRRRERYPERSVYNRICDAEWHMPPGPALGCGGDALMRIAPLNQVGGYNDDLIAGEEPELCVRLRARGWAIHVLPFEMTLHDVNMTRFAQWWMRSVRAGHAYAEGAYLHGAPPERHAVRPLARAVAWACGVPLAVAISSAAFGPASLLLLAAYPLQWIRLAQRSPAAGREKWTQAGLLILGKFAELQGAVRFWRFKFARRRGGLIEYK